jgi:F-type H+-transporting ATPase subunit b
MININWSTLVLQIVNFVVMVLILTRFFFKPVIRALDERSKRVTSALEEAERREQQAQEMQAEYEKQLTEAQEQVLLMNQRAQEELQQTRQRVLAEAREEILNMRTKTERELEETRQQAISQHRRELGRLATTLSGRLMRQAGGEQFQAASMQEFLERLSAFPVEDYRRSIESIQTEVVPVQVVSAGEMDDATRSQVKSQVNEMLRRPAEVRFKQDASLLAGATMRFGDIVIDGSLAGQLQGLSERYLASIEQDMA